jgi:hypothetical protein
MKIILSLIILIGFNQVCIGQKDFSFNQGNTSQANYFEEIPFEVIKEKIIVKAMLNGKSYRFILDTGAPTTIRESLKNELKPDILAKIPVSDANDNMDSLVVVSLSEIQIGQVDYHDIPALVVNDNNPIFECLQIDGFIGSNLLRNSIIQIDSKAKTLSLANDVAKLKLNKGYSSDIFLDAQSGPIVSLRVKNNKNRAKFDLLMDTGMEGLFDLSMDHYFQMEQHFGENGLFKVKSKAEGSNSMGLFGIAQNTTQYRLEVPVLEINGSDFLNVPIETTVDNNSRIGNKLMEFGKVVIDYKNKKFYFVPFEKKEMNLSEKQFPVDFFPSNNKLYVGFVWDKMLEGKISRGDQVISIDGKNFESIDICDLVNGTVVLNDKQKNQIILTTKTGKGELVSTLMERK